MMMAEMRDLKADLELCNKATRGPWVVDSSGKYPHVIVDIEQRDIMGVYCAKPDIEFIAQAREGWPHAIERAMRAEKLACELVGMLDRCIKLEANMLDDQHTTEQLYDEWVELQVLRNKVLAKAKEVLGDE